MSYKLSKFTLRIDAELLKKLRIIADYNDRSTNKELITLIRKHIKEFEKKYGELS